MEHLGFASPLLFTREEILRRFERRWRIGTAAIQSGAEVLKMEKSGASLTVLGRVVIAIRAPSMGGDGMTTDAPVG